MNKKADFSISQLGETLWILVFILIAALAIIGSIAWYIYAGLNNFG